MVLVDETNDLELLPALVAAGVDGFQVRAKSLNDAGLLDLTRRVLAFADGATVLVNDRVDIALLSGASGVHLGANDLPIDEARHLAPGMLIGGTCRDATSALAARKAGANYVGFGPIYATGSKSGLPHPLGPDAIRAAAEILPIVGIGGINQQNAAEVYGAGAHGVAVISAVWGAPDPIAAAKEIAGAMK
jgi:thiamine-phosphate pyrophosphorylase